MAPDQLQALLALLRASGVTRYKTPELELELRPAGPARAPTAAELIAEAARAAEAEATDDEAALFAHEGLGAG